ncbi:MAG: hypothetical protein M3Q34_03890 [bacterium]|nr:hypothetical protein [bacterium]
MIKTSFFSLILAAILFAAAFLFTPSKVIAQYVRWDSTAAEISYPVEDECWVIIIKWPKSGEVTKGSPMTKQVAIERATQGNADYGPGTHSVRNMCDTTQAPFVPKVADTPDEEPSTPPGYTIDIMGKEEWFAPGQVLDDSPGFDTLQTYAYEYSDQAYSTQTQDSATIVALATEAFYRSMTFTDSLNVRGSFEKSGLVFEKAPAGNPLDYSATDGLIYANWFPSDDPSVWAGYITYFSEKGDTNVHFYFAVEHESVRITNVNGELGIEVLAALVYFLKDLENARITGK